MLPSLTSCFNNAPARAWTSASNNAVPRMTLLREEREACTICTNRMALYLSSCTNDVTGDSSPVSAGAESFIWISWDPWAVIKQHKSMINKNVLQTGVTLMFLCKLHLNTEVYGWSWYGFDWSSVIFQWNTLHNRWQSLGVFEFLSTNFGNPHNHFFICSRITNVHLG